MKNVLFKKHDDVHVVLLHKKQTILTPPALLICSCFKDKPRQSQSTRDGYKPEVALHCEQSHIHSALFEYVGTASICVTKAIKTSMFT